jgi:CheY-like chemotaxis protein/nitrogen-specific signal transduction histidine kinase
MHQSSWSRRLRSALILPPLVLGAGSGPRFSPRAAGGSRRATEDSVLRTFFENSADPMLVLDENHVVLDANLAATHFLECPLEALRGAPVLDIDPLAQMLTTGGTLAKVRTEPSPVVDEVGITNSEGQPVQCRIEAVACGGGRTLLHLHDTTAVLRARAALRSALRLHHTWFDALPTVAWTMALPEERLLEIGPSVETLFGHEPAAFRADPELWNALVHPAERERVRSEFRRGVAAGRPFQIEFTGLHRDHRDLPHLVNHVIPIADERGWVEHCEGFIEDRSAVRALEDGRRRVEARLRHVLQAVPAGVLVVEEPAGQAQVALCNPHMARLLRLGEPPAPGTPLAALPAEARRIACGDGGAAARPAEGPVEEVFELDAPHRVLRRSVAAMRDPFGRPTGWVVAVEDITSPWLTRRRFVHAQKMESLTRLAGGIAHDFNNLLGTVAGFASLLADRTPADDPRRKAVDGILTHAERAARLTQALQTFGRTARFERIELDLNRVVDAAYPLLRAGLDSGVTLEIDAGAGLPRVHGDPVLLQQLVVQLVQDAGLTLAPGGLVRITTRAHAPDADGEGGSVEIEVSRTAAAAGGAVIAEDGAFARAAVEDIVRAHGGRVVAGEAAAPATCRVLLPVRHVIPLALLQQDEGEVTGAGTILLVEDEADLSSVTRIGLEQRGYTVLPAASGERALELLRSEGVACDLVILDLRLPGMPGEKVLEQIRTLAPELPVLIATGDAHGSRDTWLAAGADGYLAKPYRLRDLAGTVGDLLEARRKAA